MKIRLARQEEDDFDLPGAEELDKALIEHQELTEETEITQNNSEQILEVSEEEEMTDIEKAQEYFETYSKRKGKHF